MSGSIGIAAVVLIGLIVAAVMRARAISKLKPAIYAAARKHRATIHQSFLGMPQIVKSYCGRAIRMTPMNMSTSSPEGGGEMTCLDFDWPTQEAGEFRMREKSDARRNAVPTALMGGNKAFTLGASEVDERYSIVGTNPAVAMRILNGAAVVESILALPHGADIHVRGNKCYVTVRGFPYQVELIDRLFATSEHLLDASVKASEERR
jgi:hypothetical protein